MRIYPIVLVLAFALLPGCPDNDENDPPGPQWDDDDATEGDDDDATEGDDDDDATSDDDDTVADDDDDTQPLDCSQPMVNGHPVDEPACGWLEYFGRDVVPALAGSRDERLDVAATVAWWSLKEGVLFLENPIVYSNCDFEDGSEYIDPLETCPSGRAWQVGISGIQVPTFLDDRPSQQAAALYPSLTVDEVLELTAAEALLDPSETTALLDSSDPVLRTSWLLRNSPIGVTLQVDLVVSECVDGSYSWCYGSGWTATSLYAPDKDAALRSIEDIRAVLDGLAP